MRKIGTAIISVYDKRGITAFATELAKMGVKIFSTGGTCSMLKNEGVDVTKIEDYTQFPEMMDGRVKTLHPKIHGGILAIRENAEHMKSAENHGIMMFDMLVVNLYPFKEAVEKGLPIEEIIEMIDIGGPSMVRSSAKNFRDVVIVTCPDDYYLILDELKNNDGLISPETRFNLAKKAFCLTAQYDGFIASYLSQINHLGEKIMDDPDVITLQFKKKETLRYGENPHQKGTIYVDMNMPTGTLGAAKQLHGKQLSFNNYLDLESAKNIVFDFKEPACAIVKHTNPCGAAVAENPAEAYRKALAADPQSAFGSIIAFNRIIDKEAAIEIGKIFTEAIIAPGFSDEALEILKKKTNLRLLELGFPCLNPDMDWEFKKISGGLLIEDADRRTVTYDDFECVTERKPSEKELKAMLFGQKIVKHVKSNAIVIANESVTIGVGAGQMSRIDSLEIALEKANSAVTDAVIASDAFFPFRDSVEKAHSAGIKAIIQPGGSVRDAEVIEACNEYGIAMVFTKIRNFKHL